MAERRFKAAIWDIDGTALDSSKFIFGAFQYSLGKHGYIFKEEQVRSVLGLSLKECYQHLTEQNEVSSFCQSHRQFQEQPNSLQLVQPYSYTLEVLDILRGQGIKLAAVTNRSSTTVLPSLEMVGLHNHFRVVVTSDMVAVQKPHPEGILQALEILGVSWTESIMVGDTVTDILAAKAAGMPAVVVTDGFSALEQLRAVNPAYIISDRRGVLDIIPSDQKYLTSNYRVI